MKYIITESRFESLVFNYLDSKLAGTEPMKGKYSDIVFGVPGETMGLMGIENPDWHGDPDWSGTLYIDSELYTDIILMFSLDWERTFDLIKDVMSMFSVDVGTARHFYGKYFESKYNLRVERTQVVPYSVWAEFLVKKP